MEAVYLYLWYFVIYSCLGWCMEVIFHTVTRGNFVNRGFLNGPVCPIYGFGAVAAIACLTPFTGHIIPLFFMSMFITSLLELLTGYILEKIFQARWWDYSNIPFNFKGYICLKFSLLWGFACTTLMRLFQPFVKKLVLLLPVKLGMVLLCILAALYLADSVFTVISLRSLEIKLRAIEEIAERLRRLSDEVGLHLSDGVNIIKEKTPIVEIGLEKKEELDKLSRMYKEKLAEWHFGHRRLLVAFPGLTMLKHKLSLEKLKQALKIKKS